MGERLEWWWLLFGFRGRINRAEYWFTLLVFFIVGVVQALLGHVIGAAVVADALSFVVSTALFVSGLAVGAKRLHDRDKSAWWLAVFYLAPGALILLAVGAGLAAGATAGPAADGMALLVRLCIVAAVAIGVWFFVELGCLRGTRGYNRYGPDPTKAQAPRRV